jgi:hypothetical protein
MSNAERNLNAYRKPEHTPAHLEVWSPTELRRFWALARACGMDRQAVHGLIASTFPPQSGDRSGKTSLHELSRAEFIRLLNDLIVKQGGRAISELDSYYRGTEIEEQWGKIRWLQRRLKWTDTHLINYIKWHGNKCGMSVDHIRWLTVDKARAVIVGMVKTLKSGTRYKVQG